MLQASTCYRDAFGSTDLDLFIMVLYSFCLYLIFVLSIFPGYVYTSHLATAELPQIVVKFGFKRTARSKEEMMLWFRHQRTWILNATYFIPQRKSTARRPVLSSDNIQTTKGRHEPGAHQ